MKQLFILRHAEAEPAGAGVQDFDRRLSGRGRLNALRVGRAMATRGERPALVLCSAAVRTRQTLERLDDAVVQATHSFDDELYLADAPVLYERLCQVDDAVASVLLLGHNPGLAALIEFLAGSATAAAAARVSTGLPPASLAVLVFDAPGQNGQAMVWAGLDGGAGRLTDYRLADDPIRPGDE